MRIHVGRAALTALALAELGAVAGAGLTALFLAAWLALRYGVPSLAEPGAALGATLPGAALWALLVGAPAGAVLLPLLGFTLLRRVPLGRALGYALGGALAGLLAAAVLMPRGPIWPVPAQLPALALAGLFVGAVAARLSSERASVRRAGTDTEATAA
jgi:hypothetical protein